jgi:amino acid adenylation domain-containing protein
MVPPTIDRCMQDIISEQALQDPIRPAVSSWDGKFSYGEVEELSNRLAYELKELGVVLGTTIPLCFEKSRWTVVALLAVMKAGATFVLTDPHQPEGRLKTIVEEVGASLVVASTNQAELASRFAPQAKVFPVGNGLLEDIKSLPAYQLEKVPASAGLYTIFTSGSTGQPKGILLTHANYTSGALPRAEAVGYQGHSRVLDFASYAFDVSIDCMLCTLAKGGCICVPSEEQRVNDLSAAIRDMNVNMAHMTPSVARVLEADGDVMQSLEVLGLGGELVTADDAASFGQKTKVIIAYGPSECTVGCTINNDVAAEKVYTTIGKGVGGSTWIVDPDNHDILTHLGGVGELLIEGSIVGVGYLNEPEKTAQVFIEDPKWLTAGHTTTPGRHGRLYKTGDLVRYDPNGSGRIVFVGRKDRQVKLRGQRVELGEIEVNLRQRLPGRVSVAVEVINPSAGADTLVAFLAEQSEKGLTATTDILSFSCQLQQELVKMDKSLSSVLPVYMIPTAYIPLREMPFLVSCKTDRKLLREIGNSMSQKQLAGYRVQAEAKKTIPTTEMEIVLHELWANMFGADGEIGTNDSFFAIGGDSLKAMKLVANARTRGISLTVADIFKYPTLVEMALVTRRTSSDEKLQVPPFSLLGATWDVEAAKSEVAKLCSSNASLVEDIYPCSPLQEGLLALSAKVTDAYIAQRVVELPDIETVHRLKSAFDVVTTDSPILRTRVVQVPGQGLMQVVWKGNVHWNLGDDLEGYLARDRDMPMELGDALLRFGYIESDKVTGKAHIILTIHHALYDGWSMPRIIHRVNLVYAGSDIGLPTPFSAFIKYLSGTDHSDSADFWKQRLAGANRQQFPPLPGAGYRQKADSLLEHYVRLPKLATGITLATAFRGAWAVVASQYMASNDVVFGETLTGRNAPIAGIETIEGPMITTVPVRIIVDREASVSEFLQGIHDQIVLRIPHEHMGLQHIRRLSPDARDACELRVGLVLHPNVEQEEEMKLNEERPANGFVPVGDKDAAREALKFNSYGLMLVVSLDENGFLIMASFDSAMVEMPVMEKLLEQLGNIVKQLCVEPKRLVKDINILSPEDIDQLQCLSKTSKETLGNSLGLIIEDGQQIAATWIVNSTHPEVLLPVGAVGELVVDVVHSSASSQSSSPNATKSHPTGQLARYSTSGGILLLGAKNDVKTSEDVTEKKKHSIPVEMTPRQQILQRLWARVLKIDPAEITLDDSFFELGGDSISAMKLVAEARIDGFKLNVGLIFQHRRFVDMDEILEESVPNEIVAYAPKPFSALDVEGVHGFVSGKVRTFLANPSWNVLDVLPARPLQTIAVQGTVKIPRFSARYELFYLDAGIDKPRLFKACQDLVGLNEILRTIFVEEGGRCYAVVIENIQVPIVEYEIENNIETFSKDLCILDIQTRMPLGSAFVKFMHVEALDGRSCLIFRLSHAQYDEICLPFMLRQLSQLYERQPVEESTPFSTYIYHTVQTAIPSAIPYWKTLLHGSRLSILKPEIPVTNTNHFAISRTFGISSRSKDTTIASLPTAAWALTLARRLRIRDVTFGEVVSGRSTTLQTSSPVAGPCWQYIPFRVQFQPYWTSLDLLSHIQTQHISSAPHEGIGLSEILEHCVDWKQDWFDSVVHQDVEHVESLGFGDGDGIGIGKARMETYYPHMEPLREWKFQAFVKNGGRELECEIVTVESWKEVAAEILEGLGETMRLLIEGTSERLFDAEKV